MFCSLSSQNADRDYRKGDCHSGGGSADHHRDGEKERRDAMLADYKKDSEKERRDALFADYKKEVDAKRDREFEAKREKDAYKEQERKSPSTYDDRLARSELHGNRFHRESRESLREEP